MRDPAPPTPENAVVAAPAATCKPTWRVRLTRLLLGPPSANRGFVRLTLLALAVYVLFSLVAVVEVYLGLMLANDAAAIVAVGMTGIVMFYLLVRTGVAAQLSRDPSLTLPQSVFGVVMTAWIYAINAPLRGAVTAIMMLSLVWGMFVLTPRQSRALCLFAFATLGSVMVWKGLTDPAQFPPQTEAVRLMFFAIVMGAMGVLAAEMGELRHKARSRRVELERALATIQSLAVTDDLTGLANRRAIAQQLERHRQMHARSGLPLTLAMLDLDHFKLINDSHGHAAGDRVLQLFAEASSGALRAQDELGRWGGEEFLLILPGTPTPQAEVCLRRVRDAVNSVPFDGVVPQLTLSFSAGIATLRPDESMRSVLERCDRALYHAKSRGRDRIVCADAFT